MASANNALEQIGKFFGGAARSLVGVYFDLTQGTFKDGGCEFFVPRKFTTLPVRGYFCLNIYERAERLLLKQHLPKDASVLELGGCIGVVSCVANRLLDDPSKHVVVEANPHLIAIIKANRALNDCAFTVIHGMLRDAPGRSRFRVSRNILASSEYLKNGEDVEVDNVALDHVMDETGCRFNALIIDIEGAEITFFRDYPDFIKQLDFVCCEFHPQYLSESELNHCYDVLRAGGLERIAQEEITEVWARP